MNDDAFVHKEAAELGWGGKGSRTKGERKAA